MTSLTWPLPFKWDKYNKIGPGDRVTIITRQNQLRSGKAVMRGTAGWALNMGGRYGTPAIAAPDNIVKVIKARKPGPWI